jgi:hypothetical protein
LRKKGAAPDLFAVLQTGGETGFCIACFCAWNKFVLGSNPQMTQMPQMPQGLTEVPEDFV